MQEQICTYIEDNLLPDIKSYVKGKYPKINGVPIEDISIERLDFLDGPFKLLFNVEQHYYLFLMALLLESKERHCKMMAKQTVGAAIRISKDISKEQHADRITEIVNNCFTPNEHADSKPKYYIRKTFFAGFRG